MNPTTYEKNLAMVMRLVRATTRLVGYIDTVKPTEESINALRLYAAEADRAIDIACEELEPVTREMIEENIRANDEYHAALKKLGLSTIHTKELETLRAKAAEVDTAHKLLDTLGFIPKAEVSHRGLRDRIVQHTITTIKLTPDEQLYHTERFIEMTRNKETSP